MVRQYKEQLAKLYEALAEAKDACREAGQDTEGPHWILKYGPSTKISYDAMTLLNADPTLVEQGIVSYVVDHKKFEELIDKGFIDGSVAQAARRETPGTASVRPRRKDS